MLAYIFSCCMGLGRNEEETNFSIKRNSAFHDAIVTIAWVKAPNKVAQKFVSFTGTSRLIFVL